MISSLACVDESIVGILSRVPRQIQHAILNPDSFTENGDFVYDDVSAFRSQVDDLVQANLVVEQTPREFFDFIVQDEPKGILSFDWNNLPESTLDTIMDHQKQAIETTITKHNGRSLIGLSAGWGKTLIACVLAFHYGPGALLIVQRSKLYDFFEEITRWTGIDKSLVQILFNGKDVIKCPYVITTYDVAKKHEQLLKHKWRIVIVDECQFLKCNSHRSKQLIPLLHSSPCSILFSGTPQENKTAEMFNPLNALYPKCFSSRQTFTERYSDGHMNRYGVWEERGAKNLDELHAILSKCMFRIQGDNVLDLPTFTRKIVILEPKDDATQKILDEMRQTQLALAQECANDKLTPAKAKLVHNKRNAHANLMWKTNGGIKVKLALPALKQILDAHLDENIVFFMCHVDEAKQLQTLLETETKSSVSFITGDVTPNKRKPILDDLRQGVGKRAVVTIDTCGTGINLCPGVSVVVFVELHRVPGKMSQGEARAYRKGAVRPITSYWLVLEHSSDVRLLETLQRKQEINSQVLDGSHKKARFEFE